MSRKSGTAAVVSRQALPVWTCLVACLKQVVDLGVKSAHIVAAAQAH